MKTSFAIPTGLLFALLATIASGQAPQAANAAPPVPQVEIESRFITVPAAAAVRLGLTSPGDFSGAQRRGPLNSADFQKLYRALAAEPSVNLLAAPRVTTKSGQRAVIEIIREFIYPTKFDAPAEILTPTSFETRNMGVTLEVEPTVTEGSLIDIVAVPRVTTFHKFAMYAGGKTQAAGPIPRDGFSQPIFDSVSSSVSATLRPEESLLLGGFAWHGSSELLLDGKQFTPEAASKAAVPVAKEHNLLFVAITAKLVESPGRYSNALLKAGSPVNVSAQLGAALRDQLPEWVVPKTSQSLVDGWTSAGVVDPALADELRKSLSGAPGKAISAETLKGLGVRMAGVLSPKQVGLFLREIESASGGPLSAGPTKTVGPKERYHVEAHGSLRYGAKAGGSGDARERVDLQLAVEAQCGEGGTIDLNITPELTTAALSGEDTASANASGGVSAEWKLLEQAPRWKGKPVVTSVSVWSGSSIILVRASEGQPDHLQILLISATAKPENNKSAAAKPVASPTGLPAASPVPGKEGFVTSPYAPDKGYVDVRGFPAGTEVQCPFSGKKFVVP